MSLLGTLAIAGSGMSAESERLSAIASNVANANSAVGAGGQPYRAREVVFQAMSPNSDSDDASAVGHGRGQGRRGCRERRADASRSTTRAAPLPTLTGYVQMPNVNPVDEMVNMISAQQDYQANLEAFNVAKTLAMRTLTI
jgi:flagellar basal-body rod protein FlgC